MLKYFYLAGARHPAEVLLGHDMRLRTIRQLCSLRWAGQHMLNLQVSAFINMQIDKLYFAYIF